MPQGSILGPLLFTLYVNDMSTAVNYDLYLYANVSMLQLTGKDVKQIEKNMEKQMREIGKWLQSNRLSRYIWDRQSLLFGYIHKLRKVSKMKISCNNRN